MHRAMNEDEIAQFLRAQPQFFDRHPDLLESVMVPHPHGGRAIPLAERQILGLREKVRLLEGKLGELIRYGEDNEAISEKVHRLSLALLGAPDHAASVQALYFHLREDFAVPRVALRPMEKLATWRFTSPVSSSTASLGTPSPSAAAGKWMSAFASSIRDQKMVNGKGRVAEPNAIS